MIARRRPAPRSRPAVAPRSPDLGVMLPYSPLHHLLLATRDRARDDLRQPLRRADRLSRPRGARSPRLDRGRLPASRPPDRDPPTTRCCARSAEAAPGAAADQALRGSSPSIALPATRARCSPAERAQEHVLPRQGRRAWVGHHIGDLRNYETLSSFRAGSSSSAPVRGRAGAGRPRSAPRLSLDPLRARTRGRGVGRGPAPHAHLAACLAEHGQSGPRSGRSSTGQAGTRRDGLGWRAPGRRSARRRPDRARLPGPVAGGDAARRAMADGLLVAAPPSRASADPGRLVGEIATGDWESVCRLLETGLGSPLTTSVGRLFDAVAALCGLRTRVAHEARRPPVTRGSRAPPSAAPIRSPSSSRAPTRGRFCPRRARRSGPGRRSRPRPGETRGAATRFHNGLAAATATACEQAAEARGLSRVVLSGGVFQNRLLVERTAARLLAVGLEVLIPRRLPPNDSGIAFGQAAIAAAGEVEVERDGRPQFPLRAR